ncbi:MAG: hypothetical protein MZW92_40850 [Comamonadaceae bacterium]|nr:hypothetical protein [Comamonadaceae bacterium]
MGCRHRRAQRAHRRALSVPRAAGRGDRRSDRGRRARQPERHGRARVSLGDPEQLSRRYRAFLERRYAARAAGEDASRRSTRAGEPTSTLSTRSCLRRNRRPVARVPTGSSSCSVSLHSPSAGSRITARTPCTCATRSRCAAATPASTARTVRSPRSMRAGWTAHTWASSGDPVLAGCAGGADVVAQDWLRLVSDDIGFTYAPVRGVDLDTWREFLARRYRGIDALNQAYRPQRRCGLERLLATGTAAGGGRPSSRRAAAARLDPVRAAAAADPPQCTPLHGTAADRPGRAAGAARAAHRSGRTGREARNAGAYRLRREAFLGAVPGRERAPRRGHDPRRQCALRGHRSRRYLPRGAACSATGSRGTRPTAACWAATGCLDPCRWETEMSDFKPAYPDTINLDPDKRCTTCTGWCSGSTNSCRRSCTCSKRTAATTAACTATARSAASRSTGACGRAAAGAAGRPGIALDPQGREVRVPEARARGRTTGCCAIATRSSPSSVHRRARRRGSRCTWCSVTTSAPPTRCRCRAGRASRSSEPRCCRGSRTTSTSNCAPISPRPSKSKNRR